MDKWFVIDIVLIIISLSTVIIARRQGIKDIEKSKTNPSADDFEILE
jgi:hypothetical protein